MDESPIDVNSQSRALNYLFSLSAIGVSEHFTTYNGMIDVPTFHPFTETRHHDIFLGGGPYWLAMQGRTYHRIFSTDTTRHEHPAQWLLYDSSRRDAAAANRKIPPFMVNTVRLDLEQYNMLYDTYRRFAEFETDMEDAYIELGDPGTGDEIAALFHLGSAPYPTPRALYVQRAHDASPTPVPILNALYEPMQYPLLFPHATPGWGPHLKSIGWTQRAYYQSRLLTEQRFKDFGRLACEWMCDMFSRTEDEWLDYVQKGKAVEAQQFRTNVNGNESDDEDNDDEDEGIHSFTLPASFTGSPKFYANKVADALAALAALSTLTLSMSSQPTSASISGIFAVLSSPTLGVANEDASARAKRLTFSSAIAHSDESMPCLPCTISYYPGSEPLATSKGDVVFITGSFRTTVVDGNASAVIEANFVNRLLTGDQSFTPASPSIACLHFIGTVIDINDRTFTVDSGCWSSEGTTTQPTSFDSNKCTDTLILYSHPLWFISGLQLRFPILNDGSARMLQT